MEFRADERLFVGIQHGDKWYNRFKVEKPDRILDVLDTKDDSFVGLAYNFLKKSIKSVYTENGEKYDLRVLDNLNDYFSIHYIDIFAIAMRAMKVYTDNESPVFSEFLYCETCSRGNKNPQYTEIRKPWDKLIESGDLIVEYLKSYDESKWIAELKTPIEIDGRQYSRLNMQLPTFGDMMELHSAAKGGRLASNVDLKYAYTDVSIKSIDGLEPAKLKVYMKKNGLGSFSREYLKTDADIDAVEKNSPNPGINKEYRSEWCGKCGSKVTGIDLNNFFFFLDWKKKGPASSMDHRTIGM